MASPATAPGEGQNRAFTAPAYVQAENPLGVSASLASARARRPSGRAATGPTNRVRDRASTGAHPRWKCKMGYTHVVRAHTARRSPYLHAHAAARATTTVAALTAAYYLRRSYSKYSTTTRGLIRHMTACTSRSHLLVSTCTLRSHRSDDGLHAAPTPAW
jgi:hypothetical protein